MTHRDDDEYARRSFTMRRMAPWQLWSITAAVVVLFAAIIIWAMA